jgi:hypothetical protein
VTDTDRPTVTAYSCVYCDRQHVKELDPALYADHRHRLCNPLTPCNALRGRATHWPTLHPSKRNRRVTNDVRGNRVSRSGVIKG